MQRSFAFTAIAALLIAAPSISFAQTAPPHSSASPSASANHSAASAETKTFLTAAMQGDMSEIKMGQLAEKSGNSAETKEFGRTLVTDHTKAADEVKATAQKVGVTVKAEPSSEAQKDYDRLSKLKGAEFDKEFARHMVDDHQKDVAKFQKQADAKNGPVSDLAQQQLPVLKKHLQLAESLQAKQQASAPK